MSKVMVGQSGDQLRIVVAFIEPAPESYTMQTMIITLDPKAKNKQEQPTAFLVDLTSTIRNLSSGAKKQKILLLQWKQSGAIELKCDGKWTKQDKPDAAIEKIAEVTKLVIRGATVNAQNPPEATLHPDITQKVLTILNSLQTENLPCLRSAN
jgi:hypothetical protein